MGSGISVDQWSEEDVANHVASIGTAYEAYRQAIIDNGIDGALIIENGIQEDDIVALVPSKLHRKRLLRELKRLSGDGTLQDYFHCSQPSPNIVERRHRHSYPMTRV